MKRKFILISLTVLILTLLVLSLCACTLPRVNRQTDLVNVVWQTDENEYGIYLTFTVFDHNGDDYGTFKYKDKEYDIKMGWWGGKVNIDYIGYYGSSIRYFSPEKGFEITGTYKIIEKNVVEIEFYTTYGDFEELKSLKDKKITVRATDIDPDEYDVGDISEVMWQSKNTDWTLYTYYEMRRFSVGTFGAGEDKTEIAVFWLVNNTFRAYKLKEGTPPDGVDAYIDIDRIDGDAFIVGTYTNDSKQLHLTYTVVGETQLRFAILYYTSDRLPDVVQWYPSSPDVAPV